jgi:ADP-ribose pyrophosphatase
MGEKMALEIIYRGRKIQAGMDISILADGREIRRDIVLHPGAVAIIPLVDEDHICLLKNHRFILGETLWEIPAGTLEPGEAAEKAAVRELEEETGYQAGLWRRLMDFFPSPGVLSERTQLFLARNLSPGSMRPEPDEDIKPVIVPWNEALTWALTGMIRDAKTLVAILLWDRLRSSH